MAFHNPYHFVPVKKNNRHDDLDKELFSSGALPATHLHVTHDRYVAGTYSGRLICRVTTEHPIFVGDTEDEDARFDLCDPVKWTELAARLRDNRRAVSEHIRARLSPTALELLRHCGNAGGLGNEDRATLCAQLNELISGECIYEEQRFEGIGLTEKIEEQLRSLPDGAELVRLNRELLAAAYPEEILPFPKRVRHFELDGRPALPASTLRGLASSLAEAASNSALRVLEDRTYSFRMKMEESFSAVGMIVEDEHGFRLRPLTLPMFEAQKGQARHLPDSFKGMFEEPNLKVYIGDYDLIREKVSGQKIFSTYRDDDKEFFYMKLERRSWRDNEKTQFDYDSNQYAVGRWLLGQKRIDENSTVISEEEYRSLSTQERRAYQRGILRILGCAGRSDIPKGKKRELFIPYPEGAEHWPAVPVLPSAVERFHDLADERFEADPSLPYEPKGTRRNSNPNSGKFRLKHGDLVYFLPTSDGRAVEEISLSSIWRRRVETRFPDGGLRKDTTHKFFAAIDKQLLPFNKDRKVITLAEQLFGFVEMNEGEEERTEKQSLALAGRVKFSHALIQGFKDRSGHWEKNNRGLDNPYFKRVTLKILASPKPPSPALYFKAADGSGAYIPKDKLAPEDHHSQGRKFYLHGDGNSYETRYLFDNLKQKVEIKPLRPGAVFYFHIDFNNLSAREMGLLFYALQPCESDGARVNIIEGFRHKIGMGKPLGLGKIRIEPVGLFGIDRINRYSAAGFFKRSRYDEAWTAQSEPVEWPDAYGREKNELSGSKPLSIDEARKTFIQGIDPDIAQAIRLIGDPQYLRGQIHTPTVVGTDDETETFKWFVANDYGSGRRPNRIEKKESCLEPLTRVSTEIPTLEEHEWHGD